MTRLSVVVPCYNEAEGLGALRARLGALALRRSGAAELVLVDDGSKDGTWERLARWAREEPGVTAVKLAGNHGNQAAILSGIAHSRGEAVAVLDADLQDPPELLEAMLERLESQRAAAVIGLKASRSDASAALSLAKAAALSVFPFRRGEGDFCLLSRETALACLRGGAGAPFRVRRHRALAGRPRVYFPYERAGRQAGETKFDAAKLARLWWRVFRGLYLDRDAEAFVPPVEAVLGPS